MQTPIIMPVPDPQESALTNEDIVLQLALMLWDDTESLLRSVGRAGVDGPRTVV